MVLLTTASLHFILFLGTVREPRNADRVSALVQKLVADRNITLTVFDPKELHLDQVIKPIQYYGQNETAPEELLRLNSQIRNADGFIVVTAEYHGKVAPALLNLMNQFPPNAYVFRPAGIISYSKGRFGGIRAATQLRVYLSDLGMLHVPAQLNIPKVEETISVSGTTTDADVLTSSERLLDQVIWYAEAIKLKKDQYGLRCTDCFDDTNLGYKGLPYKNKKWA